MNNNKEKYFDLFQKVIENLQKYGIKKISVFGSYARGEATSESDLDLIVIFPEGTSLLDHIGIENEISEKLNMKVDILTEKSISPYLIDKIKKEAIVLLDA